MSWGAAAADEVLFGADPHQVPVARDPARRGGVLASPGASGEEAGAPTHCRTECVVEVEPGAVVRVRARFASGYSYPLVSGNRSGARATSSGACALWEVDAAVPLDRPPGGREVPFSVPVAKRARSGAEGPGECVEGLVTVVSTPVDQPRRLVRVGVRVANRSPGRDLTPATRKAPPHSLMYAVHAVLGIDRGAFVSFLEPPEWAAGVVASCRNEHTWPVLLGRPGERAYMLSSPVILPDHPEPAPPCATGMGAIAYPSTATIAVRDRPRHNPAARAEAGVDGIAPETRARLRDSLWHRDGAVAWVPDPDTASGDAAGTRGWSDDTRPGQPTR